MRSTTVSLRLMPCIAFLATLSSAPAVEITGVEVGRSGQVHPGEDVTLRVSLRTLTTPAFLYEETRVTRLGNQTIVTLFPTSGFAYAIDHLDVEVSLGPLETGAHELLVELMTYPFYRSRFMVIEFPVLPQLEIQHSLDSWYLEWEDPDEQVILERGLAPDLLGSWEVIGDVQGDPSQRRYEIGQPAADPAFYRLILR